MATLSVDEESVDEDAGMANTRVSTVGHWVLKLPVKAMICKCVMVTLSPIISIELLDGDDVSVD